MENKIVTSSTLARGQEQRFFDEIFCPEGKIRPHYLGVYSHWKSLPLRTQKLLHKRSIQMFAGDYAQDPLPRILTRPEFGILHSGVDQRARAIRAFIHDYCSQGTRWKQVIPVKEFTDIVTRHHCQYSLEKLEPGRLAFPYGPDLIRNQSGNWRVVEDSARYIGGAGDLLCSRRTLHRLIPGFREILPFNRSNDPLWFFDEMARHFVRKARKNGGVALLYLRSFRDESDQETRRLAQAFAKFGVECTTASNRKKRLIIEKKGLFIHTGSSKTKVGSLIVHSGPEQLDESSVLISPSRLSDPNDKSYFKELERAIVRSYNSPSLVDALLDGRAWTNFSPGTQFINDKAFGIHVDSMIRHFLKETPILESIPATPVAIRLRDGRHHLNRSVLYRLRRNRESYVVKKVDEDGGSGVWIGRNNSARSLELLLDQIRKEPEKFIVQDFEHLSVLEGRIVDLRLHAHVDSEKIIVSNIPWGRANWLNGNGKVNLGSGGFTSPVVVAPE